MMWVFLVPVVLACSPESEPGIHASEPVGWTADGRYFAVMVDHIDDEGATEEALAVVDIRTDRLRVIRGDGVASWRAAHPTVPVNEAATCGDATLVKHLVPLGGYPERGEERPVSGSVWLQGEDYLTLGVQRGDTRWVHGEFDRTSRFDMRLRAAWSPDCRRVGWMMRGLEGDHSVGPFGRRDAVMVMPAGPVIHIMAHPDATEAAEPIYDGLTSAGFAPHLGAAALKDREASVVYTSKAARDEAKRVAAAVPGGASVRALTWATPADIVVAAGRSAVTE